MSPADQQTCHRVQAWEVLTEGIVQWQMKQFEIHSSFIQKSRQGWPVMQILLTPFNELGHTLSWKQGISLKRETNKHHVLSTTCARRRNNWIC